MHRSNSWSVVSKDDVCELKTSAGMVAEKASCGEGEAPFFGVAVWGGGVGGRPRTERVLLVNAMPAWDA